MEADHITNLTTAMNHTQHTPDLSIPLTPAEKRWDKIADICTAVLVAVILFTGVFWRLL